MEVKTIKINSREDLEKVLKEEHLPDELKKLISASFKKFEKVKEDKKRDKFLNALNRYRKNVNKVFSKNPSDFSEEQIRLHTKALNKCSEILEHLNKEVNQYE